MSTKSFYGIGQGSFYGGGMYGNGQPPVGVIEKTIGPVSIASFNDGLKNKPLKECVVNIEPVQSGSGDPSPDNVRSISGWVGAQIVHHGENLIDFDNGAYTTTLYPYEGSGSYYIKKSSGSYSVVIPCEPNMTYTLSKRSGTQCRAAWTKAAPEPAMECFGMVNENTAEHIDIATGADAAYLIFYFWYNADTCTKEEMLATVWIEYAGVPEFIDVEFPIEAGTVYGGVLDLTIGTLTVTHVMAEIGIDESKLSWELRDGEVKSVKYITPRTVASKGGAIAGIVSDQYATVVSSSSTTDKAIRLLTGAIRIYDNDRFPDEETAFASLAANPVHVVYTLNKPTVYQLTLVQITVLPGMNTIWADTGDITIKYLAKK